MRVLTEAGSRVLILVLSGLGFLLLSDARPQSPFSEFPEAEEETDEDYRQTELSRFKVAILNELGLSVDEEDLATLSTAPKVRHKVFPPTASLVFVNLL